MKRTALILSVAMAGAISLGAFGAHDLKAGQHEYKPKADVTALLQVPLAGVEGKEVIIKHFSFPPGFVGGKHFHPGPVFVYVLEGEITIETEGAATSTISAGELYQEPLRRTMRGKNLSTKDAAKIVVFQVGDAGKPMMIKAK